MSGDVPRVQGQVLKGTCKAWKLEKGYGFAELDDGGPDLMMHQSTLAVEDNVFRAIAAGTPVEVTYGAKDNRPCASKVTGPNGQLLKGFASKLEAAQTIPENPRDAKAPPAPSHQMSAPVGYPGYGAPAAYSDYGLDPMAAMSPLIMQYGHQQQHPPSDHGALTGTVKWYNTSKGFGFLIPDDGSEQLYFKMGSGAVDDGTPVTYKKKSSDEKSWAVDVAPSRGAKRPAMQDMYSMDPGPAAKRMRPANMYDGGAMFDPMYGSMDGGMYGNAGSLGQPQPAHMRMEQIMAGQPMMVTDQLQMANPMGMGAHMGNPVTMGNGQLVMHQQPTPLSEYFAPAVMHEGGGSQMGGAQIWGSSNAGNTGNGTARCKWFNTGKGFGFITPVDGSEELYFKGENLQGADRKSVV